jgi:AGZA family xanthine/uracil permease-like MFS transporter
MSVLDTLVSLQILASVKLARDDYPTRPSLLVNGVATLTASLFGTPFPTTLYFGHMVHKSNGARAGYSVLSGAVVMLVCMTGLVPMVLHWVLLAVVAMVIVWFGLVMVGQAFRRPRGRLCRRGAGAGAHACRLGAAVGGPVGAQR